MLFNNIAYKIILKYILHSERIIRCAIEVTILVLLKHKIMHNYYKNNIFWGGK